MEARGRIDGIHIRGFRAVGAIILQGWRAVPHKRDQTETETEAASAARAGRSANKDTCKHRDSQHQSLSCIPSAALRCTVASQLRLLIQSHIHRSLVRLLSCAPPRILSNSNSLARWRMLARSTPRRTVRIHAQDRDRRLHQRVRTKIYMRTISCLLNR